MIETIRTYQERFSSSPFGKGSPSSTLCKGPPSSPLCKGGLGGILRLCKAHALLQKFKNIPDTYCNRQNVFLLSIFVLALLLRLGFIFLYPLTEVRDDALGYDSIAKNIISGKGFAYGGEDFPTIRRGPIYPYFLASIYLVFGHNYDIVRVFQATLDSVTAIILFLIGVSIFGRKVAYTASLIYALYFPAIANTSVLYMESLLTFLLAVTVLLLVKVLRGKELKWPICLGFMLGITTLCRPITILFPVFIFIVLLLKDGNLNKVNVIKGTLATLTMILVVSSWTIRNYVLFKRFVPVAFGGGQAFWTGNYVPNDGIWIGWDDPAILEIGETALQRTSDPKMTLIEMDRIFLRKAIQNILDSPLASSMLLLKKLLRLYKFPSHGGFSYGAIRRGWWTTRTKEAVRAIYTLILLAGAYGMYGAKNQWKDALPLFAVIIYFTLLHTVTFAVPRYHFPIIPYIIIFTGNGACYMAHKLTHRFAPGRLPSTASAESDFY